MAEGEVDGGLADALVRHAFQHVLAGLGQLGADRIRGSGVGGDHPVERVSHRTDQGTAVGVGQQLLEIGGGAPA